MTTIGGGAHKAEVDYSAQKTILFNDICGNHISMQAETTTYAVTASTDFVCPKSLVRAYSKTPGSEKLTILPANFSTATIQLCTIMVHYFHSLYFAYTIMDQNIFSGAFCLSGV